MALERCQSRKIMLCATPNTLATCCATAQPSTCRKLETRIDAERPSTTDRRFILLLACNNSIHLRFDLYMYWSRYCLKHTDKKLACTVTTVRSGPFKKCSKCSCFVENLTPMLNREAKTVFCLNLIITIILFGFTALSRIFHLYRADRSLKVGESRSTRRKPPDLLRRTDLSH